MTDAVRFALWPWQIVVLPAMAIVPASGVFTVTLTISVSVAVQLPKVAVAVTVYDVATEGLTVMMSPVLPSLHT